ncbi:MAG TPA: Xaa-Pro peptidase family protein [Acidobacteriota bacterium]|nr:Xaa-Pro peptidase family protein [Acidobacteriota bacterium]
MHGSRGVPLDADEVFGEKLKEVTRSVNVAGENEGKMEKVPKSEIEARISKFQSVLNKENLDGAFIIQNADIFYFSGTVQISVLFVPAKGIPILMVKKSYQRTKDESPLQEIVPIRGEREILSILGSYQYGRFEALGLEMDVLPANLYLWYQNNFPRSRWVDISHQIRRLRMIKSPYEVEQIRKAARILDKGLTEIKGVIKEGITELEVDGYLALIARREGHMGVLRMRGWNQEMTYAHVLSGENGSIVSFCDTATGGTGNTPAVAQGAGFRRIGKNEPIGIDYGVGVNGYLADQFRTFVIGGLPEELEKAHECSKEIHEMLIEEGRPGVACSHLYRLAEDLAGKKGYMDYFMGHGEGRVKYIGHGIGLEIDEYPIISRYFTEELKEGMVIALEPKFIFPGVGVVGLEDDYLVTPTGLKRLTLTDQVVMKV